MAIPIDIYSGFLGAGKTTLIRKMITEAYAGEKIALIENEFGEVGIDSSFLKSSGMRISELSSGCICCSLAGDFTDALVQIADTYAPDRILIEPSGVAALSDVMYAIELAKSRGAKVFRNCSITVADAERCEEYLGDFGYGEIYENQIHEAMLIVLSRSQNLSEEELPEVVRELSKINPKATFVTTPWEQLKGAQLLTEAAHRDLMKESMLHEMMPEKYHDPDCTCGCHNHHDGSGHHEHHSHEAEDIFSSWGAKTPSVFTEASVRTILDELESGQYGAILRAKGILPSPDGWLAFDYVPGEKNIRPGEPDVTGKICVIGIMMNEKGLSALFGV